MTTTLPNTNPCLPADQPLALRLSEGLGPCIRSVIAMANLELAAAFGAADAAKEQDLRGYYPMAARVLAEEVRRLKAERDSLAREAHVWSKAAETYAEHEADTKRLDWLMANSGLILGHGWWALKTYADTAPDDALGVLDWIDAAMVRAEDADARNEELAARAN